MACMHVRCGFCREECPVYKQVRIDSYAAKGKLTILYWLLKAHAIERKHQLEMTDEVVKCIYSCTTCGFCNETCGFPVSDAIEALRFALVKMGKGPMEAHKRIEESVKKDSNPYLEPRSARNSWFPSDIELSEKSKLCFHVGCTMAYRSPRVAESIVRILDQADLNFTIMADESCCGSVLLRSGQRDLARELAMQNLDRFSQAQIATVVTGCPGCYRTFATDYPKLVETVDPPKIMHTTQLLSELLRKRKIRPKRLKLKVTYHDPCHLGRHSGIYEEPRRIIKSIPGMELVEMDWNRKFARCCGAGGGFRGAFGDTSVAIGRERLKDVLETGAEAVVTACPFCERNLRDAARETDNPIEVYGLEELLYSTIK